MNTLFEKIKAIACKDTSGHGIDCPGAGCSRGRAGSLSRFMAAHPSEQIIEDGTTTHPYGCGVVLGKRYGCQVLIYIDTARATADEIVF